MRFQTKALPNFSPQEEACSACEQLRKNVVLERNQVASVVKLGAVATLLTLATTTSTQKELRQEASERNLGETRCFD